MKIVSKKSKRKIITFHPGRRASFRVKRVPQLSSHSVEPAMSRLHKSALPVLIVIEFLVTCHTPVSSQNTTKLIDETTEISPTDNSTKIYYYIIGILLGLTIILFIILLITCWVKAKKKGDSDNISTTTTYKDEKFSDWFAFGKKKKAGNSPQKGIRNEETRNGKTQDTTFNPVTGEGGYSKYFDGKK